MDGEDDINGLVEYGYGYWSRFVWNWNKNKLLEKDAWVGMSRMTTNKDYRSDNSKIGDRTLAVWIGNGYYHFATYTLMDK